MKQNNFFKIFAMAAFVVLLGVSCWATVESLQLLLPEWPLPLFWAVTVIFFVVSSIGSKLIVDSLNQKIFVDNRGWRFIGGLVLMLAFWVCFSLPTNTHTFFFRASIKDVVITDLQKTKSKLQDLDNDGVAGKIIAQEKADFENRVDNLFSNFAAEINNPGNPGWAEKAQAAFIELERELGPMQELKLKSKEHKHRQELIKAMRKQVEEKKASKVNTIYATRLNNINRGLDKPAIKKQIAKIQMLQDKIDANDINLNKSGKGSDMNEIDNTLSVSYAIIAEYSDAIIAEFDKTYPNAAKIAKEDKATYSAKVTKAKRMLSVIDVWKDFFHKQYSGRGFLFWILLAALVDIAGFIFFDLAFTRRDV